MPEKKSGHLPPDNLKQKRDGIFHGTTYPRNPQQLQFHMTYRKIIKNHYNA